ncbi:MAG: type I restriction enzyme HsdR N-terminal domain-containing protein [Flavobacteriaceae bacterium]|jgi:hypothetical protein|nr:type I restriction enzyme HsdR N-terminal domain-containing protein [Flavobacteriaceae bacterium]
MELPVLNFPQRYSFQIKENNSLGYIFDEVRKKWVILTPEEWVRQHVVHYLKIEKKIPDSAFLIEKKLTLNRQIKRLDILVMKKIHPWLLVECKASEVPLTRETFEQAARYNIQLKAQYILITNGLQHIYFFFDTDKNEYRIVEDFKW